MPRARRLDQPRRPMPTNERRIGPLKKQNLRPRHIRVHEVDRAPIARAQVNHRRLRLRPTTDRFAHAQQIVEHIEHALGIEAQHHGVLGQSSRNPFDTSQVDRADIAKVLRQDHIGLQRGEKFFVELVQTVSSSNRRRNFRVDSARIARVDARAREQWNRRNPRRKVAFMAAAHEKISRTDGAE